MKINNEDNLSGTLAIDLGNTNTVIAFQSEKDINPILIDIPYITSCPGVIPTAVWFDQESNIVKIGVSAIEMKNKLTEGTPQLTNTCKSGTKRRKLLQRLRQRQMMKLLHDSVMLCTSTRD